MTTHNNHSIYSLYSYRNEKKERRSTTEIIADILTSLVSKDHIQRSRIRYYANMSNTQAKQYLIMLSEKGFIQFDNNTKTKKHSILITEKGKEFIHCYNQIKQIMDSSD